MKITYEEAQLAIGSSTANTHSWVGHGVSIDSRTINPRNIFIAIKGESFDGHDFLQMAADQGAVAAIVDREMEVNIPTLVVKDTLKALQGLARYKRTTSSAKMIAITGSVGKTITKEMVHQAISCHGKTYRNSGNLNNHIGLPLSLLNAPDDAEYIILEMGMNHAGEIKILTSIMKPDIAIITNIGPVHLEFFSSVQGIAEAKAEIFMGTKGTVILNKSDDYYDYLYNLTQKYPDIHKVITIGKAADSTIRIVGHDSEHMLVSVNKNKEFEYAFSTIYEHLMMNSLFPLAVTHALGLDVATSAKSMGKFEPQDGRGKIYYVKDIVVIDDTYNASPPSMQAALHLLSQFKGRKIAVLGDMLELGKNSNELHKELVNTIIRYKIDLVFTVGDNMKYLYDGLDTNKQGSHFSNSRCANILPYIKKEDIILVKGSCDMKMELIIQQLLSYDG